MLRTLALLVTLLAVLSSVQASAGSGEIVCELATYRVNLNCDDAPPSVQQISVGDAASVTFTVEWTPVSSDAQVLYVHFNGNPDCVNEPLSDAECWTREVQGTSPLSVHLNGTAASNTTLAAYVGIERLCGTSRAECPPNAPPRLDAVKLVRHQQYSFSWSIS